MGNSNRKSASSYQKTKLDDSKSCICSTSAIIFRTFLKIEPQTLKQTHQRRSTQKVDIQTVDQIFEAASEGDDAPGSSN